MESFFAMLKKEELYQMDTAMLNRDAVKIAMFRHIRRYNLCHISSATGGLPPMAYREGPRAPHHRLQH